jgi:hypothetical protein
MKFVPRNLTRRRRETDQSTDQSDREIEEIIPEKYKLKDEGDGVREEVVVRFV